MPQSEQRFSLGQGVSLMYAATTTASGVQDRRVISSVLIVHSPGAAEAGLVMARPRGIEHRTRGVKMGWCQCVSCYRASA
jgi:hypothetical protein